MSAQGIRRRLDQLEKKRKPSGRVFTIFERDGDRHEQEERLRREEGLTDADTLVIVRWMSEDESKAPHLRAAP